MKSFSRIGPINWNELESCGFEHDRRRQEVSRDFLKAYFQHVDAGDVHATTSSARDASCSVCPTIDLSPHDLTTRQQQSKKHAGGRYPSRRIRLTVTPSAAPTETQVSGLPRLEVATGR